MADSPDRRGHGAQADQGHQRDAHVKACEACGRPLDSDHLHLCGHCAATIDRATDELLERELFDPGGGWE